MIPTRHQRQPPPFCRGKRSTKEHDRFLAAVHVYPEGPWVAIAKLVHTRSPRQVQTHAQKYQEKVERWRRGLQRDRNAVKSREHRVQDDHLVSCEAMPRRSLGASTKSLSECSIMTNGAQRRLERQRTTPRGRSEEGGRAAIPPPCLQRLRALPPSPVSVQDPYTDSDTRDAPWFGSFEQSLDFLIECLSGNEDIGPFVD